MQTGTDLAWPLLAFLTAAFALDNELRFYEGFETIKEKAQTVAGGVLGTGLAYKTETEEGEDAGIDTWTPF